MKVDAVPTFLFNYVCRIAKIASLLPLMARKLSLLWTKDMSMRIWKHLNILYDILSLTDDAESGAKKISESFLNNHWKFKQLAPDQQLPSFILDDVFIPFNTDWYLSKWIVNNRLLKYLSSEDVTPFNIWSIQCENHFTCEVSCNFDIFDNKTCIQRCVNDFINEWGDIFDKELSLRRL